MRNLLNALALTLLVFTPALAGPPRPDADMQRLLDAWTAFGGKPLSGLTPAQARSQPNLLAAVEVVLRKQGKPSAPQSVAQVLSATVPGSDGDLPVRVYQPAGEGPFPLLVYFHGGGWVLGGIEDYDSSARALANTGGCVVISVGYRQAPEHPYPAPLLDAYAAFSYIGKNAEQFNGDKRRVAIGGEGAGANLASAVCLRAMELRGPMPIHQLLVCPITDVAANSPSYRTNANARPYSADDMRWFFQQYLKKASDRKSPYVSILNKTAIDLPSATVIVAELDPLRSQGEAYHKHLLDGAVDSQLGLYSGVTADFFGAGAVVAKAKKAVTFAGKRLRKAFTINRPNGTWDHPHTVHDDNSMPAPSLDPMDPPPELNVKRPIAKPIRRGGQPSP